MDTVVFDVPSFLERLPKGIDVGETLCGDWRVEDVYWGRHDSIQIQVGRGTGPSIAVLVMPRDDQKKAYRRTPSFNIVYKTNGGQSPVTDVNALASIARLASAIAWADSPPRKWVFPDAPSTLRAEAHPRVRSFNLAIDSPCSSHCSFCSLVVTHPPRDTFDEAFDLGLRRELERGRAEGVTKVRINGIEPLTYPRIVPLLRHATAIGYDAMHLLTTGLSLADETFAADVVGAMPPDRYMDIPLYGSTAAIHDAVTGHAGSFAKVMRALENLRALVKPTELAVTSVIVRDNLHDHGAMQDLARRLGFPFQTHMPYPSQGGRADPYRRVVPRMSDAVSVLHGLQPPLPVHEAPPCILLRHERETGIPSLSQLCRTQRLGLGNAYRSDRYVHSGGPGLVNTVATVRCPHAGGCAAADRCTQEVYRAYFEVHGLDELRAVAPHDLPDSAAGAP
jgi:hypothetical protein